MLSGSTGGLISGGSVVLQEVRVKFPKETSKNKFMFKRKKKVIFIKGLEKLFIEVYVPKNQYAIHSYNPENFNLHYTCLKKKPEKVHISLAELLKRAGLEGKEVEIH